LTYAETRRPAGHSARRRAARRRLPARRLGWRGRLILAGLAVVAGLLGWGAMARGLAPRSNTARTRFDAIIVLGYPADSDGNPTPAELARVTEGAHEYSLGVAPRLILTGGRAHNKYVEAEVMARTARALGIPDSALFLEPEAQDTIENACYAERMMKAHGWRSAEVVSEAYHLPRAGLIFSSLPLEWRTHAAPPLQPEPGAMRAATTALEVLKTTRYLVWGRYRERCEP